MIFLIFIIIQETGKSHRQSTQNETNQNWETKLTKTMLKKLTKKWEGDDNREVDIMDMVKHFAMNTLGIESEED